MKAIAPFVIAVLLLAACVSIPAAPAADVAPPDGARRDGPPGADRRTDPIA